MRSQSLENTFRASALLVFKTGAINHSATSPAELTLRTLTKTAASRVRSLHHAEISVLRQ
jgi:hypothetical protein